ncbi:MAG: Hsp20/alpha crystallin family protein [bacterium]
MTLARQRPVRLLKDLDRQLNQLFPWEDDDNTETAMTTWSPKVDVYEEDDNLVFELEAPGVDKDDIDVSIEDNRLTIKGERREEKEVGGDERDYYRSERFFGSFQRSFALPDKVDVEDIDARYDNGVLTVSLPKASEARKTTIEIN